MAGVPHHHSGACTRWKEGRDLRVDDELIGKPQAQVSGKNMIFREETVGLVHCRLEILSRFRNGVLSTSFFPSRSVRRTRPGAINTINMAPVAASATRVVTRLPDTRSRIAASRHWQPHKQRLPIPPPDFADAEPNDADRHEQEDPEQRAPKQLLSGGGDGQPGNIFPKDHRQHPKQRPDIRKDDAQPFCQADRDRKPVAGRDNFQLVHG